MLSVVEVLIVPLLLFAIKSMRLQRAELTESSYYVKP